MITLEYDGTEQSLADWGFAMDSAQCEHVNLAPSRYALDQPGASLVSDPTIPFRGKVLIRRQRTLNEISDEFEGGYVAFIGYRTNVAHYTSGSNEGLAYTFENAWHFLNNTPYQQPYASYNTVDESLQLKNVSELLLFTRLVSGSLTAINAGDQIEDILQFVIDIFAAQAMEQPFIIGTIDPDIPFPSYQAREMMSATAILKCLELSPDVVSWFDYTTDVSGEPTPTIHFLTRTSRASKSLAIKNGTDHVSLNIVPRHDLVPRSVVITYKITGTQGGHAWIVYAEDKYGPNGQNSDDDPNGGLGVLLQTIELQGFQAENATIHTQAVDCNASSQADRKAWWSQFLSEFLGNKVRNVAFSDAVAFEDPRDAMTEVDLGAYQYRLMPKGGSIYPWMVLGGSAPVVSKAVTILATVTYDEYDREGTGATPSTATNGCIVRMHDDDHARKLSVSVVVTNAPSGVYSITASGEAIPGFVEWDEQGNAVFSNGIASKVYGPLSVLQYQGNDVRVQAEISNADEDGPFITLANKLNLTAGHANWATMDAQIQSITEHDGSGQVSISFGPARHISAGDLAAMFQFNRLRRIWYQSLLRETADLSSQSRNAVQSPAENNSAGLVGSAMDAVTHDYTP